MARQYDWYTGQLVSQQELDGGFANLEAADRAMMADAGFVGIFSGFVCSQHTGTANLTVDLTAGVAYSLNGERLSSASALNVNCAYDHLGAPTAVQTSGKSKILSVYLLFDRLPSDPRTDATNTTVYFVLDETIVIEVVQGAEATVPTAPAAPAGGVLVADVTLTFGQTTITNSSISTARRADQIVVTGTPLGGRWGKVAPAFQAFADAFNNLISGSSGTVPATAITYGGQGTFADTTSLPASSVEAAIDTLVLYVGGVGSTTAGDVKLGVYSDASAAYPLSAGTLRTRLQALRNAETINYYGSPTWADATAIAGTSVENALDLIVSSLAAITVGASGAGKIGAASRSAWLDGTTNPATTAHAALGKIITDLSSKANGTAGSEKVGFYPTGDISADTVGAALRELDTEKAALAGATFTGDITAGGGAHVKLSSRSITRAQTGIIVVGTAAYLPELQANLAAGAHALQELLLPNGVTLTGVAFHREATARGATPGTSSQLLVWKADSQGSGGTNTTTLGTASEGSLTLAQLNAAHDLAVTGLTEVIDRARYTYYAQYINESGSNSLTTCAHAFRVTYTTTQIDDGY